MKKSIVAVVLVLAALAVLGTGVASAQGPQPPQPLGGATAGSGVGPLHTYMVDALAGALGLSSADFEARRASGESAYQIALDLGFSAQEIPALLSNARLQALDAAQAAGAITQQQTDWMKSRPGFSGMGNCNGAGQHLRRGMGR